MNKKANSIFQMVTNTSFSNIGILPNPFRSSFQQDLQVATFQLQLDLNTSGVVVTES